MGVEEWFMKRTIRTMSPEEKKSAMQNMTNEFFASMTPEEKKELMQQVMPQMMEKMMGGLTAEDRQELMFSMMSTMMPQMFSGQGGISSMMRQMMSGAKREENSLHIRTVESQEDFKPWKLCPCRKLCTQAI